MLISFFIARYLTVSPRGPVLTLRRGALRRGRISLLNTETFFYFGGGWGHTFRYFKSLEINVVYALGANVNI